MKLKGGEDSVKSLVICLRIVETLIRNQSSLLRYNCKPISHGHNLGMKKIKDSSEKRNCKDKERLMFLPIDRSGGWTNALSC
jgi:hypothetical protein